MVTKSYTECDWCKKIILHNEKYFIVFYKKKGQIQNIKPSESVCKECFNKKLECL